MKQYTPHMIKLIEKSLIHGDKKRIADELELSQLTVQKAFNDKALTPTNRRIFEHAEMMIQQHKERFKAVKA
jgi:hypothetical protein